VGSHYLAFRRAWARRLSRRGLGAACILLLSLGCQASVRGDVKAEVRHDSEEGPEDAPDFNKPVSAKALLPKSETEAPGVEATLLGARRDMSLVAEHASATCACLKVAIGSPPSAAFKWQGPAPRINDETQLAIALSSEGMPCGKEPKGSSGASYWGYRISGNDVVVFVENARSGPPRVGAAIIPKPLGAGQVYVAPAKSNLPYGRSPDGKAERCKIGNAPVKRTTPFTAGELGDTSARDANAARAVDAEE